MHTPSRFPTPASPASPCHLAPRLCGRELKKNLLALPSPSMTLPPPASGANVLLLSAAACRAYEVDLLADGPKLL